MRRLIGTIAILTAMVAAGVAFAQSFTPPPGAEMEINLYPASKFRGAPEVITKDTPHIGRPIDAESLLIIRGIWELCSDTNYGGRCTRVDATQVGIPIALTVRSARLVGDQGANFVAPPMTASKTKPLGGVKGFEDAEKAGEPPAPTPHAAPAPVVAPEVAQGGAPGTNPSLRGSGVEFFAAPASNGLRVLACSQGALSGRCIQSTADGFCAEKGYAESAYSGSENLGGRAYLVNVLCKSTADAGVAKPKAPASEPAKKRRLFGF